MMRRTKIGVALGVLAATAGTGAVLARAGGGGDGPAPWLVVGERGDLVDFALAVGTIEPDVVISVKSMLSGVVSKRFADVGDFVRAGDPLLEIRPTPTPVELADARRLLELRTVDAEHAGRELERHESLLEREIISAQEQDAVRRRHAEAVLQEQMARDRLALLEQGRITIGDQRLETVVRAPVSGYILEKMADIGDPVVPLSSFQPGTALMTMADMDRLVFRGTVDEIDVGRLREGMAAEIHVGALPEAIVRGELSRISLQSKKEESSTVFPIEIDLTEVAGVVLRAGYSATAHVEIARSDDALLLLERLLEFENGRSWVTVSLENGTTERRRVETGLSDAINVEVVSGLAEGDRVVDSRGDR